MADFLSPKVIFQVIDLSQGVPQTPSTWAGLAGRFRRGPLDPTFVTNVRRFKELFTPSSKLEADRPEDYAAVSYLQHKGAGLWVVRVVGDGCLYGGVAIYKSDSASSNAGLTSGLSDPTQYDFSVNDEVAFIIVGANPGSWNNNLSVKITDVDDSGHTFVLTVYETVGGVTYERVSRKVSRVKDKKDGYGRTMYIGNVFAQGENDYIWVVDNPNLAETVDPKEQATALSFTNGADGSTPSASDIEGGWEKLQNTEQYDVQVFIQGGIGEVSTAVKIQQVVEQRQDAIAILDVPYDLTTASDITDWRETSLSIDSPYCSLWCPWIKIKDWENDTAVDIAPSGVLAGLLAETSYYYAPWILPMGMKRGVISCLGLTAYYDETNRDLLDTAQVNCFRRYPGGYAAWNNRTLQVEESAMSYFEVVRLIITIRKQLSIMAQSFLFDPLTEATRRRFASVVDGYMAGVKAKAGVYDYRVICDPLNDPDGNNPPDNVDQGILTCDIWLKPTRAIRGIMLRAIIVRNAVDLNVRENLIPY